MSTTVTYKGSTLTTVNNQTRTLKTAGKYMEGDVILVDVSSSGGYVTQDANGYIILPASGDGGGGSSTPSATHHEIYFEFSDNTNITIDAYYDSSFISNAITATTPTTYNNKTVTLAELDGTAWYSYNPSETWETVWNGNVSFYHEDNGEYPYCWIPDLGNVAITVGSVWRITYNNVEYRCTAKQVSTNIGFGNPKWAMQTDDGTDVPFWFDRYQTSAWTGSLNATNVNSTYHFKIEHLVTT